MDPLIYITATGHEPVFDEFVPGKGEGIVMLLCGAPGVGQTLSAEAVWEYLRSPLYRPNIQDFGT